MKRGCIGTLCLLSLWLLTGCVRQETVHSRQIFAMDTIMEFTVWGPGGEAALDKAEEEIHRLDDLLSTGNPDSKVSRLNREGGGTVSEDVGRLISASLDAYHSTGGIFDFTIYPLMELWGFPARDCRVPGEKEIADILPLVDASLVQFSGGILTLAEDQQMDFGGIAKGYAASRLMEIFQACGVTAGMVSLGGNVQTFGVKPGGSPWRIGIQDPNAPRGNPLAVFETADRAVVTSGGYERYFEENGRTYSHILSPSTGYPVETDLASATVISADGVLADVLSTALYSMGLEAAIPYWRDAGVDFDMVLLTSSGTLYVTEGVGGLQTDSPVTTLYREP